MSIIFKKLCKEINFHIPKHLDGTIIHEIIQQDTIENAFVERKVLLPISFYSIPTKDELIEFCKNVKSFFAPYIVEFDFKFQIKNFTKTNILGLIAFHFNFYKNEDFYALINEDDIIFDVNKYKLILNCYSNIKFNLLEERRQEIAKCFSNFGINEIVFEFNNLTKSYIEEEEKIINDDNEKEYKNLIDERKQLNDTNPNNFKKTNDFSFKNQKQRYFKMNMKSFYETEEQWIMVEGMIFDYEFITTKTDLKILTVQITDFDEAIAAKMFIREENNIDFSWLEKNSFVSIYGEKKIGYNSELYLQIKKVTKIENQNIVNDNAPIKRIELSARTSMSAMDGFISAEKMLEHAKSLGHDAIGFVDFQNIQAYPEIFSYAKKIGIKPIYGSTFSLIDSHNGILKNQSTEIESVIENEKYIIFDLETTSLNPRSGEIIEFGAVEMINSKIIKTHQFFIRPKQKISAFTTNLTGITQQMVDDETSIKDEKEAIKMILEIFKDHTLVAHNATFDISYIKEKIFKYDLEPLKNRVVDTLSLAKFLIETSQNYRLETVSKKYGILYDPTVAHRADYDAQVLQKVWLKMIEDLSKRKIKTFNELDIIDVPHVHNKKIPYEIAIYAKNQIGLKELFKYITLSSTTNYYAGPRLFGDKINKSNNLLIGPASTNTKLIDLMFVGTTEDIVNEINKWDFIGIPSPHLLIHHVSNERCSHEELLLYLKEIILIAKKMNKIIVAIGDVRYLNDYHSIGHQVYINTKGLEGRRHPLFRYNNYPIQKFLTTNQMKEQFSFLNSSELVDEIVVKNAHLINDLIEKDIEIIKSKLYTPNFDNSPAQLEKIVYENAHKKYGEKLPEIVEKRIKRELDPIIKYGFSVVYWISHKLVAKSINDGYLVGSRGSVGSSLVATLSGITEVNPLIPHYLCTNCKYSEFVENAPTTSGYDLPNKMCPKCNVELKKDGQTIPFETFLGFNADKVPDIDLNFSGIYQPIIHQEIKNMFGHTHSFRAGTIATVASKTAFGFVKKWNEEKNLGKSNTYINYLASMIEGSKRTTGQHPGGIIIIPKEFDPEDFTPVNYPANDTNSSWMTTHFDFHAIHDNVLKLDLLGHDDPTIIKFLQKNTNVKLEQISFSDKKVISLFTTTEALGIKPEDINNEPTGALGIPEFGTRFVRRMLNVAKPKTFNDLINLSGLSHGTDVWTGNAEELIKSGLTINDVISCRDDIMVYLINKNIDPLTSFNIMEKVRKGKGLTKEDESLLKENDIEQWYIDSLNKIKYMFPKAHATAYVMMAWRIAWFKIYYPLEYYASYYSIRTTSFDIDVALKSKKDIEKKLKELENKQKNKNGSEKISAKEEEFIPTLEVINEMLARGIKIKNIDLYKSDATEWVIDYENNSLIPPFLIIDGLGDSAANSLVAARKTKPFSSIDDLLKRTQVNRTSVDKMISLGILNGLSDTDQIELF